MDYANKADFFWLNHTHRRTMRLTIKVRLNSMCTHKLTTDLVELLYYYSSCALANIVHGRTNNLPSPVGYCS